MKVIAEAGELLSAAAARAGRINNEIETRIKIKLYQFIQKKLMIAPEFISGKDFGRD